MDFWKAIGIVTGGQYDSKRGCQPYAIPPCDHFVKGRLKSCQDIPLHQTPRCKTKCEAGKYHDLPNTLTL